MSKKGFTLTELLAVIVILGVVMTIGSISVTAIRQKIDQNMFENSIEFIINAAKSWGNDNKQIVKDSGTAGVTKNVDFLISSNYLETEETANNDGTYACSKFSGDSCFVVSNNLEGTIINNLNIKIYMRHDRVYACIFDSADNLALLVDPDKSIYSHLNYYCS